MTNASKTAFTFIFIVLASLLTSGAMAQIVVITEFETTLDEDYVILGGIQGTGSSARGTAQFTLMQDIMNPANTQLAYNIQFQNVDLDGAQTTSILDNISALHLHDTTQCAPLFPQCIPGTDTAGTIHILNIFGAPRNDDADVMVDPVAGTIRGIWDVSDTSAPGTPVPTLDITSQSVIDTLLNGEAALFVHTNEFSAAASGGSLNKVVPEPGAFALIACGLVGLLQLRRRRR